MNIPWVIQRIAENAVPGADWNATAQFASGTEYYIDLTGVFPDHSQMSVGFTFWPDESWRGPRTDVAAMAIDLALEWVGSFP